MSRIQMIKDMIKPITPDKAFNFKHRSEEIKAKEMEYEQIRYERRIVERVNSLIKEEIQDDKTCKIKVSSITGKFPNKDDVIEEIEAIIKKYFTSWEVSIYVEKAVVITAYIYLKGK